MEKYNTPMYSIELNKRDLIKTINFKFKYYLEKYRKDVSGREELYMRAFNHYLVLTEYGMFPREAAIAMDELIKLHIGYTHREVMELCERRAQNSINHITNTGDIIPLSEEENKAIDEYQNVLFGSYVKKENL